MMCVQMQRELTHLWDVLKKIKNYCDAFVIVTGPALALPPPVVLPQHNVVRVPQAWMQTILM